MVGAVATGAACAGCGGGSDEAATPTTSTTDRSTTSDQSAAGSRPDAQASVDVGPLDDVRSSIGDGSGFLYVAEARAYLVAFPEQALDDARAVYDDATVAGMESGFVALHQKCTHLGCRVPECAASGRFECPCHGGMFSRIGEYIDGPAPRGLDRFAVSVESGRVMIDTSTTLEGAAIGVRTVADDLDGESCLQLDTGEH